MPLRTLPDPDILPALDRGSAFDRPGAGLGPGDPPPRILLLYGSLRERSYSRLCVEEAARLNAELQGRGRVLVRPSGTEPLIRVLGEAETREEAEELCGRITALVRRELG